MRATAALDTATITAATLGAIGALHVAWGLGATFPYRDEATLTDRVVGRDVRPSPAACNTVAALLTVAALSVERAAHRPTTAARVLAAGVSMVLAGRAAVGFAGRTDRVVPGSSSDAFRRNDRRVFAPLCAALALGAARSAAR